MASFQKAIGPLIRREGGYNVTKDDHGGPTKFGISSTAYPKIDIESLTRDDAEDIYLVDYWRPLRCDQIVDQRVAEAIFDFGVNSGVSRSAKAVQIVLGVQIDGDIGPITLAAINAADPEVLALRFALQRIAFYTGLALKRSSQRKFLPGWIARSLEVALLT